MTEFDRGRPVLPPAGWRGLWNPRRAQFWLIACVIAVYLPLLGMPLRGWLDFSSFYAGGSLVMSPDLVRLEPIREFQVARALPLTPWVYPPSLALLYGPLAALPYDLAAAVHVAIMLGLLVVAARYGADLVGIPRRWAVLGSLAWAPAAAGVVSGQNTSVALMLVVLVGVALVRRLHAAAGILTGLLAYKPQLAPPVGGTLLLRGHWGAVVLAGAFLLVHYGLGVVATGGNAAWPADWIETLNQYTTPDFRENGWQAVSLPGLGHRIEILTGVPGVTLVGYAIGSIFVLASLPALRRWPPIDALALACSVGLVVSPHAWVYDATLLLPAIGVLAARSARRGWPWRDRWLLAIAFATAATWPVGGFLGGNAVIAITLATPIALLKSAGLAERQIRSEAQ